MKIGRNDPCPCGSGKKYKFCCLKKIDNTKTEIIAQNGYEYCILFNDSFSKQEKISYDEEDVILKQIYHVIWYIMHLPRSIFDFYEY